jgi:hypothetical protein
MIWLLPSAFVILGAALLSVFAVHFIARSRPLAEPLPTARFIPERAVRARTRSFALSDVLLLVIRALAFAALAAAVAGPVFATGHGRTGRVIVADRTPAVANLADVRDSVRAIQRPGDVLIPVDSAVRGSLSAGLAAAIRAGASLATRSDSLELILVSSFAREEVDAATLRLRAAWPGRARLVRVRATTAAAVAPDGAAAAQSRDDPNDAVIAGLSLAGLIARSGAESRDVRVQRGRLSAADSVWALSAGHVLVHWPSSPSAASWRPRTTIDAIGAVVSASGIVVGRFPRPWILTGTSVARWADGEAAAVEHRTGDGCIRDVGVLVDESSDLTLQPAFGEFARALLGPCGGAMTITPPDSAVLAALAGRGSLAPAAAWGDVAGRSSPWTPWLLAAAALLLILELALRRGGKRPATI